MSDRYLQWVIPGEQPDYEPVEPDYEAAERVLHEWLQEREGITEIADCVDAIVNAALGVDDE